MLADERHPVSRRPAVIEDDGRCAWLYLGVPDGGRVVADCWLYNRAETPGMLDESDRGRAPVVPASHARLAPPPEGTPRLLWSTDGESVAAFFGEELLGFIAAGEPRGYSRHLHTPGPFGQVLDPDRYERLFAP